MFFLESESHCNCKTGLHSCHCYLSEKPFLEVVDLTLHLIKNMLDETCDDAKDQMKQLSSDQIGSWSSAVTCCDGCWLIRRHFSQNCTPCKVQIEFAMRTYGKALPSQGKVI